RSAIRFGDRAVPRKGIGLTFPNRDADRPLAVSGNASELGDVCGSPGKSSLFFLTDWHPGISLKLFYIFFSDTLIIILQYYHNYNLL
ncbi:hypothetical protein AB9K17_24015, partial [Salmonella enterica subsp. enterica serovar Kentucky]|uniref:hypothetical protein n=1 Tax=Salmonella enterica TaxID=28901 RepID=UPI003F4BE1A3